MFKTNKNDIFAKPMSGQELHATTKLAKADHKPLIEYINWSELVEDFDLKTGDLDYSDHNKIENIINSFIKNNEQRRIKKNVVINTTR